jgi:hypothetical protein
MPSKQGMRCRQAEEPAIPGLPVIHEKQSKFDLLVSREAARATFCHHLNVAAEHMVSDGEGE